MSGSKREREYARRRYEKQAARQAKAAKLRRERTIVASVVLFCLVIATAVLWVINRNEAPVTADPTPTTTSAAPTPPPADALPTTNPDPHDAAPPPADALGKDWLVTMTTNMGDVVMTLDGALAPQAVASFVMLASDGYFDGTACHRLLPDSLLQCGDPTASGSGGPGYSFGPIENAPADGIYPAGTVAMARPPGQADGMGSQFFLVFADVPLPADGAGGYSVFGQVTSGLDILAQIGAAGTADGSSDGRPIENVIIESVEVQ